jgi:hypothetical protein
MTDTITRFLFMCGIEQRDNSFKCQVLKGVKKSSKYHDFRFGEITCIHPKIKNVL